MGLAIFHALHLSDIHQFCLQLLHKLYSMHPISLSLSLSLISLPEESVYLRRLCKSDNGDGQCDWIGLFLKDLCIEIVVYT